MDIRNAIAALVIGWGTSGLFAGGLAYPVVGTGQAKCYDDRTEITPPAKGELFYGQDAQFPGPAASYTRSTDGLTVQDNVTGLVWQASPNVNGGAPTYADKVTSAQARQLPARLNAMKFGGFGDWRLPTVKELYSLILFSGVDTGPEAPAAQARPFIDAKTFRFEYGFTSAGERTIDSQWVTSSTYVAHPGQVFGVNFADGRIKGYGTTMPGRGEKKFFAICCRGNPLYGKNDFRDNADGTVTDRATGLMWSKADSGKGMNWPEALAWVQARNAQSFLGHNDWRLPNAKELQSIVDYSRSPDTTASAAIDPVFNCTGITNEAGKADFPFYWTSTTHVSVIGGGAGVYVAFGRGSGWPSGMMGYGNSAPHGLHGQQMPPPPGGPGGPPPPGAPGAAGGQFADVHGAGAQRSDPKTGDPSRFPRGRGPQGDVVRIYNFVRLVRGGGAGNP